MSSFFFKLLLFSSLILMGCESEYSSLVKHEMEKGEEFSELFLGLKKGLTKKEFFDHCWALNKDGTVSQGPGNKYAKTYMDLDTSTEKSSKVEVLFYGIFDEKKVMYGMEKKIRYEAWAPWNEEYHAPALVEKLKGYYMEQYAKNPFIEIEINDKTKAFVKVDGYRQILIYPLSNKDVMVKIEDLRNKQIKG